MSADNREHPGKLGNASPDEVADEQFQRRSDAAADHPEGAAARTRREKEGQPPGRLPSARGLSGHAQKIPGR